MAPKLENIWKKLLQALYKNIEQGWKHKCLDAAAQFISTSEDKSIYK